ncbi:MAG: BadF/BadG/BcrA/BcrD ATPase family protein [Xanthobacteraceae bacterium]
MEQAVLLLGIDGGGTRCRARLSTYAGEPLGEAVTGPANLRLGVEVSFSSVVEAARQCLDDAGLPDQNIARIVACLALAGASEPAYLTAARKHRHPFRKVIVTTDAHAACVGAHGERDGGVIVAGTGTVAWAVIKGKTYRVGGWGLPISDEGSGAWIGSEALRRVLWAHDGRVAWTPLLRTLFADFAEDPHAIVSWTATASPRDFGSFAPCIVDYAGRGDAAAIELLKMAAAHIDRLAARLVALGAPRVALVGGFAAATRPWLAEKTRNHLVEPAGDAVQGALTLARSAAEALQPAA